MGEFKMEIENIVNVEIDAKHNLKMYLPYKEDITFKELYGELKTL